MIHFVLAVGPPGSCTTRGPGLARAVGGTTSIGGDVIQVVSPTGTWAMAAVAAADPLLDHRWCTDGEGLVVCNGAVTGDPSDTSPEAVLARFRSGGLAAATAPLSGTAGLACLSPEHGLAFTGGEGGFSPLFHGAADGLVVVSNRATTVSCVVGDSGWDPAPLGWLVGVGHLCGDDQPARGARSLPVAHVGRVPWGGGALHLESRLGELLPGPGAGRPHLTPAEWDAITEAMVAEVRPLGALGTPLHLPITGGKDSRLLLSLVVAAGMADAVQTYTSGGPDSEEVACAAAVAAAAGVSHRRGVPPEARHPVEARAVGSDPATGDLAPLWRRVARGGGRFDGSVATWATTKTPTEPGGLFLKGWGGEIYRYKTRPLTLDALEAALPSGAGEPLDVEALTAAITDRTDPLGVLLPVERARQHRWMRDWVTRSVDTVRADLLPDLFYMDQNIRSFHGPITQGVPLRVVANPLVSRTAIRTHAELALGARSVDRLHFEVMRRAAPALVALPFHEQVWAEEIRATADVTLPAHPFGRASAPAPAVTPRRPSPLDRARRRLARRARVDWLAGTRWSTPRDPGYEAVWSLVLREPAAVTALFREAAGAGLADICRVDRLCRLTERPGRFTRPEELQLTNAIGAAMLLLGRTQRVVETP